MKKTILTAMLLVCSSILTFAQNDVGIGTNTPAAKLDIRGNGIGYDVFNASNDMDITLDSSMVLTKDGFVGIGQNSPLERLHLNGALLLGNTASNNPGTIRWDGSNFLGYNGSGWVFLDIQNTNPWIQMPNVPFGTPELTSGPQPMSLSFAFPGTPNPLARLYVTDFTAPALFPHQLAIETITGFGPVLNASQLYRISVGMAPPFIDYSVGLFGGDGTYKVCFGAALTPTAQSDATTMIRANNNGIIDLANQSRVRAYQVDPGGVLFQTIFPFIWTPVNFTFDAPLPVGYDEQGEFTLSPAVNTPTPAENAFFTATQEGYYQVNARCEFNTTYSVIGGPVFVTPASYVSIAIWVGPLPGATISYAIGNNLQIGYAGPAGPMTLQYNDAPNVSDVVYLLAGQIISIWVFHTAASPMDLMQGSNIMYVSIHKVS